MTDAITVVAHITADPEWAGETYRALLNAVEKTQGEAGCMSYRLYGDSESPNQWTMLEQWRDADALAQHASGSAFKELIAKVQGKATIQVFKLKPLTVSATQLNHEQPEFWLGSGLP